MEELRVDGTVRARGTWKCVTHFGVQFTSLHFPQSLRLNFTGTSLSISKCSHDFKNEFYQKVNTDLWIGTKQASI